MKIEERLWYEIIIDEPNHLPGSFMRQVIKDIESILLCKYIVMDYLSGAIPTEIFEMEKKIVLLEEVIDLFLESDQICWGEFFLFKEIPFKWKNEEGDKSPFVIRQSDTTVRAVDQTYVSVYTQNENVSNMVLEKYAVKSHRFDYLENYVYPG